MDSSTASNAEEIEERAAEFLAKRDGDAWTEADQAALSEWLDASTAHRVAFLRLDAAWKHANRLKALAPSLMPAMLAAAREGSHASESSGVTNLERPAPATRSWKRAPYRALAASLILALSVGWYLWPVGGPSYSTGVGGVESVPLADGSKVTLNTDSEIRVTETPTERRVMLVRGEAFFEVAKDPTRPFIVSAGQRRVIAVGTKFSVLREADEVRVVVTEGGVRFEKNGGGPPQPVASLAAGAVARASDAGTLVQEKPLPEAEEILSWRSGYLVFRDTTLADAVAEFNRYNEQKLVIEDPALAAIHIGGNFRSTNVDAFVRLLEQGFPIHADRQDDRIVLTTH
jgi:transmembrane sensor